MSTETTLTKPEPKTLTIRDHKQNEDSRLAAAGYRRIPGFTRFYAACVNGTIFRLDRKVPDARCGFRFIKARELKPTINNGYAYVTLTNASGVHKIFAVHRLVASAFHPNPENKKEVNHINGFKSDNWATNLEWSTRSENQLHAVAMGLKPSGAQSHRSKLTEDNVREIRKLLVVGEPQKALAATFGVSQTCISKIATGKKWKNLAA